MALPVVHKIFMTITFPAGPRERSHVHPRKLHSLAKKQLPDTEVIETIDHLFKCHRCFETYRCIRTSYLTS